MRIGILTFHRAHNYGAMLQAYALQVVLETNGHDVSFVDYELPHIKKAYKWFYGIRSIVNRHFFTHGIKTLYYLPASKSRYNKFRKFCNSFLHDTHDGLKSLNDKFDIIIVGSDQVFNMNITAGINNPYWGDIPFTKDIITYAASSNTFNVSKELIQQIPQKIKRFKALSVRESFVAKYLQSFTEKDIVVTLDPTLLISRFDWEKIVISPKYNKKYIFYYYVRDNERALEFAYNFAKSKKLPLIVLGSFNYQYSTKIALPSGPREFLGWIMNAEYVISSSFHCTVFSLIFNKQFCSIDLNDGNDGRISSLLERFDLSNRMVKLDAIPTEENINWIEINNKLCNYKEPSLSYLYNNIK